ncbi:collagen alpha-1(I) chain-like [Lutra lutra]|uniref:collagen alpha-1(I) chain-like n=1 Tax=Lutra lutra TaxID=9657 RepID=UPI001FD3AFD5|nr:collagen alpha-1(I) chain-like [Lutra lutra]
MGAGRDRDPGAERGAERDAPPPSPPRRGIAASRGAVRPQLRDRVHKLCQGARLAPGPQGRRGGGRRRPYLLAPPPAAARSPAPGPLGAPPPPPRAARPGPPLAAALPHSSAASLRGSARQVAAGSLRPGPGGGIGRGAAGPALNPWGPGAGGAGGACGAAGGGSRVAGAARPGAGTLGTRDIVKHFPPVTGGVHCAPSSTSLEMGPLGSQVLAATPGDECPPEGVGKVDPPQVRGRCNSFSQTTNGIPLVSLPSHLLRQPLASRLPSGLCAHASVKGRLREEVTPKAILQPGTAALGTVDPSLPEP